jgi:hypothetical protein
MADLSGAKGITNEELEQQAKSLKTRRRTRRATVLPNFSEPLGWLLTSARASGEGKIPKTAGMMRAGRRA